MAATLGLSTDEMLATTRSVRRRLDLERPVERDVLEDCLRLAQQAPTGSNAQWSHFVVVTDAGKRAALADLYRRGFEIYRTLPFAAHNIQFDDPIQNATLPRVVRSGDYLAEHMHEVPVLIVACIMGRFEGQPPFVVASVHASVVPAVWSFMLAARSRGLGTCLTTVHLFFEEEAAAILGIPYAEVTQVALIPVAYTKGTDFKPAYRLPLEKIVHYDSW
jgi:nitroreductase